jgi:hypothetical protein
MGAGRRADDQGSPSSLHIPLGRRDCQTALWFCQWITVECSGAEVPGRSDLAPPFLAADIWAFSALSINGLFARKRTCETGMRAIKTLYWESTDSTGTPHVV